MRSGITGKVGTPGLLTLRPRSRSHALRENGQSGRSAAAVPTRAKIPAPTMPPIPSMVKSTGPSTRFNGRSGSGTSEEMLLMRSRFGNRDGIG